MCKDNIVLKFVFRYKVCINYYGPSIMRFETLSIVASTADDALRFIYSLYKSADNLYSIEFIDKTECVVL